MFSYTSLCSKVNHYYRQFHFEFGLPSVHLLPVASSPNLFLIYVRMDEMAKSSKCRFWGIRPLYDLPFTSISPCMPLRTISINRSSSPLTQSEATRGGKRLLSPCRFFDDRLHNKYCIIFCRLGIALFSNIFPFDWSSYVIPGFSFFHGCQLGFSKFYLCPPCTLPAIFFLYSTR